MALPCALNNLRLTNLEGCLNTMATMTDVVSNETDPLIDMTMTFPNEMVPTTLVMASLKLTEITSDSAEEKISVAAVPTVKCLFEPLDDRTVLTVTLELQKLVVEKLGEDTLTIRLI